MPSPQNALAVLLLLPALTLGCKTQANSATPPIHGTTPTLSRDDPEQGFTPLFDGETLDGWHSVGGNATYEVRDGVIVGFGEHVNQNTFLRTDRTYTDFEFRGRFRMARPSNSGIQYRSHQKPNAAGEEVGQVYGYQYEIDPRTDRAWTAGLYEEGRRGWLQDVSGDDNAEKRAALDYDGWNEVVIRCEGNHIQTWLNGVQVTDYVDDADEALTEGFFGLQVHGGNNAETHWRDLRVKELD